MLAQIELKILFFDFSTNEIKRLYRIAGIGPKKIPIQNENSKFRVILQMQTEF
jgi:hypothetical protein